ncbi:MAG: hypothetical protein EA367_12965 [Leptolyngbya sp. DLM2.Bin15]|nr:MAG: hypothetical protein EA367_12965 [Leptolyngbya sp. DLM2.Bin15]
MKQLSLIGLTVAGVVGLHLAAVAQPQTRELTIDGATIASFCRSALQDVDDLRISEVHGGMGVYPLARSQFLGFSIMVVPVRHLGGHGAVRSQLDEAYVAGLENPRRDVRRVVVGQGGVLSISVDRDGMEQERSLNFLQDDFLVSLTAMTAADGEGCGEGGFTSLVTLLSQELSFETDQAQLPVPAPADIPVDRILSGAQPVGMDHCLIGTWSLLDRPFDTALFRQAEHLLSSDQLAVELDEPAMTGTHLMTVESDGSIWTEWNTFTMRSRAVLRTETGDWVDMTQESILEGAGAGNVAVYRRNPQQLLWITMDMTDVNQQMISDYEAQVYGQRLSDRQTNYNGPAQSELGDGIVDYDCRGNQLSLRVVLDNPEPELPPMVWRYQRLR